MDTVIRYSPVVFQAGMEKSEARDGFLVALPTRARTGPGWWTEPPPQVGIPGQETGRYLPLGIEMPAAPA